MPHAENRCESALARDPGQIPVSAFIHPTCRTILLCLSAAYGIRREGVRAGADLQLGAKRGLLLPAWLDQGLMLVCRSSLTYDGTDPSTGTPYFFPAAISLALTSELAGITM